MVSAIRHTPTGQTTRSPKTVQPARIWADLPGPGRRDISVEYHQVDELVRLNGAQVLVVEHGAGRCHSVALQGVRNRGVLGLTRAR
jgi:hypothetical protein